jgi:hypothetical protein
MITSFKKILLSIGAGFFLGSLYTILFMASRRIPLFKGPNAHHKQIAVSIFFTMLRFLFLAVGAWYFFMMSSINPIIMILSFLGTFWLLMLKQKAFYHEGHRSFRS